MPERSGVYAISPWRQSMRVTRSVLEPRNASAAACAYRAAPAPDSDTSERSPSSAVNTRQSMLACAAQHVLAVPAEGFQCGIDVRGVIEKCVALGAVGARHRDPFFRIAATEPLVCVQIGFVLRCHAVQHALHQLVGPWGGQHVAFRRAVPAHLVKGEPMPVQCGSGQHRCRWYAPLHTPDRHV